MDDRGVTLLPFEGQIGIPVPLFQYETFGALCNSLKFLKLFCVCTMGMCWFWEENVIWD